MFYGVFLKLLAEQSLFYKMFFFNSKYLFATEKILVRIIIYNI